MEWHPRAPVLLAGTADGNTWMWKVPTGDCKTFQGPNCPATCGRVLPDGESSIPECGQVGSGFHTCLTPSWAMVSKLRGLLLRAVTSQDQSKQLPLSHPELGLPWGTVCSLASLPASFFSCLMCWCVCAGCRLFTCISDPSGKRAVVGYEDGTIRIWDLKQGNSIHVLKGIGGGEGVNLGFCGERAETWVRMKPDFSSLLQPRD